MKLLALCDSPTLQTGFARVAQNLLPRWLKTANDGGEGFDEIDVWGIGYEGNPHDLPFRIWPAQGYKKQNWQEPENLTRFLRLLDLGQYTHLWMMQDTFLLSAMAREVRDVCERREIRSVCYFPVDAPMEPEWVEILHAVDVPVAYGQYGKEQALAACVDRRGALLKKMRSIPHGCDAEKYRPLETRRSREFFSSEKTGQLFNDGDFLIVNVNMHQRRKGILQSIEVARELGLLMPRPVKLYLHMRRVNAQDDCDLGAVARRLGMEKHVFFAPDNIWPKGVDEASLNKIYNAADLLLTTSLGEGWGLSITEAMSAGTPVAGPRHTSIAEIMDNGRGILFNAERLDWTPFDNSRLRPRTDVEDAAQRIFAAYQSGQMFTNAERAREWVKTLDWDGIARKWLDDIFEVK